MKNILLVDDDPHTLEALALRIGGTLRNWNILTALDSIQGLSILDTVLVEFILTDVQKPATAGYRIIERRNQTCPRVPVFAMTDDATPAQRRRLKGMRVSACIERPFDFDELATRIVQTIPAGPEDRKEPFAAARGIAPAGGRPHD